MKDKVEKLPFTLLKIDDPVRTLESMSRAIYGTDAGYSIALGELRVGLVDSMEARPTSVDLKGQCQ